MADAHNEVEIDRDGEPYRWRCPNGHTSWERTNNHIHCPSCRRALENNSWLKKADSKHREIVDEKARKTIPYSAVTFAEDN